MRLKPSRIILTLLLALVATNALWLWSTTRRAFSLDSRDTALLEQARGLAQLRTLVAASLTGRPLADIEPTLRRLFPDKETLRADQPKAFIIGDLVLMLDANDKITGVANFVTESAPIPAQKPAKAR